MSSLRRILLPLDGSAEAEGALRHGAAVARSVGARLHVVRVVPPGDGDPVQWRLRRSDAVRYLENTVRPLEASGLEVRRSVLAGRPAEEIVASARRLGADLVVLTPGGGGGPRPEGELGGTSLKVVHRVGTSVLLARPGPDVGEDGYRSILVPVDASPAAEWALGAAGSLLPDSGGRLLAVHAVERPAPHPRPSGEADRRLERRLVERRRAAARRFLDRARRRVERPGVRVEPEVFSTADVARELDATAVDRDVDLVLLGAHGRPGPAPWPYGGVSGNLLLHGRRPTLVLSGRTETRAARPPAREDALRPARTPSAEGDAGGRSTYPVS